MSAAARSATLRPNSSATPHSVTMVRTCARVVTTPAPGASVAVIRERVPAAAVDGSATELDRGNGVDRSLLGPP